MEIKTEYMGCGCGITVSSQNAKLSEDGKVTVWNTRFGTCPTRCPFREGCYARGYTCVMSCVKHAKYDLDSPELDKRAKKAHNLVRANVCGDIAIQGTDDIDFAIVQRICQLFAGKTVWGYTHCAFTQRNREIVDWAKAHGYTINWSCESEARAKAIRDAGYVAVLASDDTVCDGIEFFECHGGHTVNGKKVTCSNCKKCMQGNRSKIPVFRFHGLEAETAKAEAKASI